MLGLALIVGLIWLGASLFSGNTPAFLAGLGSGGSPTATAQPSPLERIRASGTAARDAQRERIERQLEPQPPEE